MVAREDIPSRVPDLVVPAVNSEDEISEQATSYVNAVYFVNWQVIFLIRLHNPPTNAMEGYLRPQLSTHEPARFSTDPRDLRLHECEGRRNCVSLRV